MEISSLSSPTLCLSSLPNPSSLSSTSSLFFNPQSRALLYPTRLVLTRPRPGPSSGRNGLRCTCLFGLGVPELAVIAGVTALVFGPKKLPEIGRSIGKTVKSFQEAAKEFESELKKDEPASVDEAAGTRAEIEKDKEQVPVSKDG